MSRTYARQCHAPGARVARGEVLVATEVGDPVLGLLPCPAAPLVGGVLERRGIRVRYGPVPQCTESSQEDGGAALFVTSAASHDGSATGIAAAANDVDGVAVAAARGAVEEWSAVVAPRRALRSPAPWCQGALAAMEQARQAVAAASEPVYLLEHFAAGAQDREDLSAAGAVFATSLAGVPAGATVMLPAHGVAPAVRQEANDRGLTVIDATCPLVAAMHGQIRSSAGRGDRVVVVGKPAHAVTAGALAQAPGQAVLAETSARAGNVGAADPRRISYVLAPGTPVEEGGTVISSLRSRFPALHDPDPGGLCYAASDRAETIRAIAAGADLVLVLGAEDDPDTRMVTAMARAGHAKAQAVARPADVIASWLAGVAAVGLVETVSADPGLAAALTRALAGIGPLSVTQRAVTTETVSSPGATQAW